MRLVSTNIISIKIYLYKLFPAVKGVYRVQIITASYLLSFYLRARVVVARSFKIPRNIFNARSIHFICGTCARSPSSSSVYRGVKYVSSRRFFVIKGSGELDDLYFVKEKKNFAIKQFLYLMYHRLID